MHSIYYDHVSSEILLSLKIQIISIIIGDDNNEGMIDMSATTAIKDILEAKGKSQAELAEEINVTRQNLSNKLNRDKLSALELVEIADALEMNLILKDKVDGAEYTIDYPDELKGKSKRNMTEEEKKAAQKKSEETKARNAKQHKL